MHTEHRAHTRPHAERSEPNANGRRDTHSTTRPAPLVCETYSRERNARAHLQKHAFRARVPVTCGASTPSLVVIGCGLRSSRSRASSGRWRVMPSAPRTRCEVGSEVGRGGSEGHGRVAQAASASSRHPAVDRERKCSPAISAEAREGGRRMRRNDPLGMSEVCSACILGQ
eukprot:3556965-Pleurochrysis_carterae.AAC.1